VAFLVLGAYLTYALRAAEIPTPLAVVRFCRREAIVGMAAERLMLRPMARAPLVAIMMATLGMMILINAGLSHDLGVRSACLSRSVSRRRVWTCSGSS